MGTPSRLFNLDRLNSAISTLLEPYTNPEIQKAFEALSLAYRTHSANLVSSKLDPLLFIAYAAARMPATYAAVKMVLSHYSKHSLETPKTLLDIGAGPATATLAAFETFDSLGNALLLEKEPVFCELGKKIVDLCLGEENHCRWQLSDIASTESLPSSDLVIASYSLGELPAKEAQNVASRAFGSAKTAFILIEPGTPKGFSDIRSVRNHLLSQGAHIAAPCPHQEACPMTGSDFCHFSVRLERQSFHRIAKAARLSYEDEKFSYAIFTKQPVKQYSARIVKKPIKGSGHITLDLCQNGTIKREVVPRSQKEKYKSLRKSNWGDAIS